MQVLFKNNKLISRDFTKTISVSHMKVFNVALLHMQRQGESTTMTCMLKRTELIKLINDKNITTNKGILDFLKKFGDISLTFAYKNAIIATSLMHTTGYYPEEDAYECRMERELFETITEYQDDGYTPLDLNKLNNNRNLYTIRLYEELRKWSAIIPSTRKYTLSELRRILLVGNGYTRYYDLKKRVLLPAITSIKTEMNMDISIEEFKVGNRVTMIEFTINDNEPRHYVFENIEQEVKPIKKRKSVSKTTTKVESPLKVIDNITYVDLVDAGINPSIHSNLIEDFPAYKNILNVIQVVADRTLRKVGAKTINKRNYKYFKTALENELTYE